jgi:hypothetical protein
MFNDARDAVFQRLSVLQGLGNLEDSILDEVIDTGSHADYGRAFRIGKPI